MKNAEQETEIVTVDALAKRAAELKDAGWRLVQGCATTLPDQFEVTYSFDQDYKLLNLRVYLPKENATLPSLTPSFPPMFTYENEFKDLFGIKVEGLVPDFGGNFYRKAAQAPFATTGVVVKGGA
jgi:ech hydrogenase subunit D